MSEYDDRIDKRVSRSEKITIICDKCGALFRTKNISNIGARTISFYYLEAGEMGLTFSVGEGCDKLGHSLSNLRILTDNEMSILENEDIAIELLKLCLELQKKGLSDNYRQRYLSLYNSKVDIMENIKAIFEETAPIPELIEEETEENNLIWGKD